MSPHVQPGSRRTPICGSPPVVLTVAGSDNSGGAGIQADLKTMNRMGVYGCSAVTCVVAEHPGRVARVTPIPTARVIEQMELVAEAFPLAALKTGMLYSKDLVIAVADWIAARAARGLRLPVVVDPVMVATSGADLLKPGAVRAVADVLIPQSACVTPNLDETRVLLGWCPQTSLEVEAAAREACMRWQVPFVIKGGHLPGDRVVDVLAIWRGRKQDPELHRFTGRRVQGVQTHGTGCTFSAAIASRLALGDPLPVAVRRARGFVARALRQHFRIGSFTPLNQIQLSTTRSRDETRS